jgi:uncharacterized protein YchJ
MSRERRMVKVYNNDDMTPLKVIKQRRNDPCYCGSGKKSKHCCGEKELFLRNKPKS